MEYFKKYRIFYLNPVQISIGECVQQGWFASSWSSHDGQDLSGFAIATYWKLKRTFETDLIGVDSVVSPLTFPTI